MYSALLSVLVFGLVPAAGTASVGMENAVNHLAIAPPPLHQTLDRETDLRRLLSASGITIVDLENANVIFSRSSDKARPMGSLTKLMTALILSEHHDLDELVTVSDVVKGVEGSIEHFAPGEQYTVGDLLTAMLLASANDAAYILAEYHGGTVNNFVAEMNARAASLGLTETSFADPAGLDSPKQHASPRDLAWLTAYAWRNPVVHERMSLPSATITSAAGRKITVSHTHQLLQKSQVLGGKTGTTNAAQQCLSSIIQVGSRQYVVILLNSLDRYGDMNALLNRLQSGA